jgi:general secretion pathway protein A
MKRRSPFSLSPNPNCLCLTESITAVLERARFVIDNRQGLTVIVGNIGLGKSTITRYLYNEYDAQDDTRVCMIESPEYKRPHGLLRAICLELKLEMKRSFDDQLRELKKFASAEDKEGRSMVLFIDEAQKLTTAMFELLRTILNYETSEYKLVQIVLAGQQELTDKLLNKANKAIYSRVIAPSNLNPLSPTEVREMIEYRCRHYNVRKPPFSEEAVDRIYELTQGVPRDVLKLCAVAYEMKARMSLREVGADLIDDLYSEGELKNVA